MQRVGDVGDEMHRPLGTPRSQQAVQRPRCGLEALREALASRNAPGD